MIVVNCPNCKSELSISNEYVGQAGKCQTCGGEIQVPGLPDRAISPEKGQEDKLKQPHADNTLNIVAYTGCIVGILAGLTGFLSVPENGAPSHVIGCGAFLAAFTSVMLFLPSRVLSSERVAGMIGTSNPLIARALCAVAAVLFWFVTIGGLFFVEE